MEILAAANVRSIDEPRYRIRLRQELASPIGIRGMG
jgi:hypothetical protein